MIKENRYLGMNTFDINQGTPEWLQARMGVITASRAHEIIKPGRKKGSYSEARKSYMSELIGQVCTAKLPEQSGFKQAEWGHENEAYAREAFEARSMCVITECGLVYKDESLRAAISPDGLDLAIGEGLEIKCPWTTKVHIDTMLYGDVKPEYLTQCQFSMWATGYKRWNFCSFDYRMLGGPESRLHVIPQERDEELMEKFDVEIPKFVGEMDEKLQLLGFKFGQQWKN